MIEISDVAYTYPGMNMQNKNKGSIRSINLNIKDNQITTVLGHSGSGKSTLLRLIAGLMLPDRGSIKINGKPVLGCDKNMTVVSTDTPLYPWMTVEKNIAFALKQYTREKFKARTNEIIDMLGIGDFKHKYPNTLSSGMTKQAMLARAFVIPADILLLDEPFSEIDPEKRVFYIETLLEISEIKTILLVTHDIEEAVKLSSQIYLLSKNHTTIIKSWSLSQEVRKNYSVLKNEILAYYNSAAPEYVS